MMKLKLNKKWGSHKKDSTIVVDNLRGKYLKSHGFVEAPTKDKK